MEIDRLVETLSWRDVLYEVMSQMDPWDVDIGLNRCREWISGFPQLFFW